MRRFNIRACLYRLAAFVISFSMPVPFPSRAPFPTRAFGIQEINSMVQLEPQFQTDRRKTAGKNRWDFKSLSASLRSLRPGLVRRLADVFTTQRIISLPCGYQGASSCAIYGADTGKGFSDRCLVAKMVVILALFLSRAASLA